MSERITLKSECASAELAPAQGGRLVSLRLPSAGYEFLTPRTWSGVEAQSPAAGDSHGPMLGVEDLFPFRRGGRYPVPPYEKIEVADLGDVRRRGWQHERRGGAVRLWVADKRFGYKLEKRVSFASPGVLRLDYRLDNVSDDVLIFVWFGRIALPLHRGVRLVLPEGRKWRRLSAAGSGTADSSADQLLRGRPAGLPAGSGISWLTADSGGESGCGWIDEPAGVRLTVRSQAAVVPHLAVEIDRGSGGAASVPRVCLEPATAAFDGPDGVPPGPGCRLEPLQSREWWLELEVAGA